MEPEEKTIRGIPRIVRAYPPTAILTVDEVAEWLGVGIRLVERLDIPSFSLGERTRRYMARDVIEFCDARKAA
jgi:hypothetical protein